MAKAQDQGLVPDSVEYAALRDLYINTNGANWTNNTNWPSSWPASATSDEFSTWFGVSVYAGDVYTIDLPGNNLVGGLDNSIGNLTQMVRVVMTSNGLSGNLPDSLGNVHGLTAIYLDYNQFSGAVPAWTGEDFPWLQYLNLNANQLSGAIPSTLATLPRLDLLTLISNQLTGEIPAEFAAMTWLGDLRLSSNPFTPGPIPSWIGQMSNLRVLGLNGCNLTGTIPAALGDLSNLQFLYLNGNSLTGGLPSTLANCTALQQIDIINNQLTDLSADLSALDQLSYLGLTGNQFQGQIPEWIGGLASLGGLYLNANQFSGNLPTSFANLSSLTHLYLQDNQLTGSLPDATNLENLMVINIANNHFSGTVPASYANCNMLIIDFTGNQLSGTFPSMSNWTNLQSVTITGNQFTGAFPSVEGIPNFTFLEATSNAFTSFHVSLLSRPLIHYISFQNNNLARVDDLEAAITAGNVHPSPSLGVLYIDYNQLDYKTLGLLTGLNLPVYGLPQKEILDERNVTVRLGETLSLASRPMQATSSISWEKIINGSWQDVTTQSEDNTHEHFLLNNITLDAGGAYRWKMTDTQFEGSTIWSYSEVTVDHEDMVPDSIELIALKDFYDSLNGDNWVYRSNWPSSGNWPSVATSADFATWEGLRVEHGDVVFMGMNGNNMEGIIPASLSLLSELYAFHVGGNRIGGTFPTVIFSLAKLNELSLGYNLFTGEIPSFDLAKFNLSGLQLGSALFTGDFPDLSSQTHMDRLSLAYSNFTPGPIPESMNSLVNLNQLYIADTKRTGTLPTFADHLTLLSAETNQFSGAVPAKYADYNIQIFNVAGNQLSGEFPSTRNWSYLVYIGITGNQFTGTFPSLEGRDGLTFLEASSNKFTSFPARALSLPNINYVGFQDNEIKSVTNVIDSLSNNQIQVSPSLTTVHADLNRLDFAQLLGLKNANIPLVAYHQKVINDVDTIRVQRGDTLRITSRPVNPTTTTTWYKKEAGAWVNASTANEDVTATSFLKTTSTIADEGLYYWSMTDTAFPDVTIQSDTIVVQLGTSDRISDALELQALKDIYDSLGGINWVNRANWPSPENWPTTATSADFASWFGITVVNGDIQGINFPYNNLAGQLPQSVYGLTELRILNIPYNALTGTLSPSLNGLIHLGVLDVGGNQFTGDIPYLGSLSGLGGLSLYSNPFNPGPIPEWVGTLTNITALGLQGTNRNGSIPDNLQNLSPATVDLNSNALTGSIPTWIGKWKSRLWFINLSINQLSGSIPSEVGDLTGLAVFGAASNQLTGSIPESLGNITGLSDLLLENNQLSGPLPKSFSKLLNLYLVSISNNQLSGSFPDSIRHFVNIVQFSANQNKFTGSLAPFVGLPTLQQLSVDNNQFDFSQLTEMVNVPGSTLLPQRPIHDLDSVSFNVGDTLMIPSRSMTPSSSMTWYKQVNNAWIDLASSNEDATRNTFLRHQAVSSDAGKYYWSMADTQFADAVIQSDTIFVKLNPIDVVPDSIEFLVLKDLYDSLAGAGWTHLTNWPTAGNWPTSATSSEMATWSGVTVRNQDITGINFYQYNLNGKLPGSLQKLERLDSLELEENQLSGTIPSFLGNLTQLRYLSLSLNPWVGCIPSSFASLTKLKNLRIALCPNLTGPLPEQIGQMKSLEALAIWNTAVNGSIPSSFGDLTALRFVELSSNQLSGTLPESIGNMTNLTQLQLSYNQLSGDLPVTLKNLPLLRMLIINNNHFTGQLLMNDYPGEEVQYTLDASNNEFTSMDSVLYAKAKKWGLSLHVSNNRLDFSQLAKISQNNVNGTLLVVMPQKNTNDIDTLLYETGARLEIPARPLSPTTTILWKKKVNGDWVDAANNEDASMQTFLRSAATLEDAGVYSWITSDTQFPEFTIQSDPITILNTSASEFQLTATITSANQDNKNGGIHAVVSGGTLPYTYEWSSGESTDHITSKSIGSYTLNVSDALGQTLTRTYQIGYAVQWSKLAGVSNNNGELIKTATAGWGNAGADSGNLLDSDADGWIEFILTANQGEYAFGFGERGSSFNYPAVLQGYHVSQEGILAFLEGDQRIEIGPYKTGQVVSVQRENGEVHYSYNGQRIRSTNVDTRALIVKAVNYAGNSPRANVSFLTEKSKITKEINAYAEQVHKLPEAIKITREGRKLEKKYERLIHFNNLLENEAEEVFIAPPCLEGNYYAGFKLVYDRGDQKTEADWLASLEVTLLHGTEELWTRPLQINMREQTFEAITFHDTPIACGTNYQFIVKKKTAIGEAPQGNIDLAVILHQVDDTPFSVNTPITDIYCPNPNSSSLITWKHSMHGTTAYDVEWVFIDDEESTQSFQTDEAPFNFNEPVRVTVAVKEFGSSLSNYLYFYPKGRVWHRIRAVGYDPAFPEHRINGQWNYGCSAIPVNNQEPDKNWARQTVFAEDGKFKEVVHYYDATSRERQVVTNLSTEQVNVVGETHYDFEGRPAVHILPVPSADLSLTYKPAFNQYVSNDPTILSNISSGQNKFYYDNRRLENGVLKDESGAGAYYSDKNSFEDASHIGYTPKADGFVYTQTEFTNDGTGRVTRQSGVGNEFRLDGNHTTQSFYATATTSELIRLFGSNAGNAAHYRKTAVLDPNGQASITYTDQEGRTIATALAGEPPATGVDPLKSYTQLSGDLFTNDISNKNVKSSTGSQTSHIFLNLVYNTPYTFQYSLSAMASQVEEFGCQDCNYDVKITITDPEGDLVDLSAVAGNESISGDKSYQRKDINATCTATTTVDNISIPVTLGAAGEYTITKILLAHEQTFEQMKTALLQDGSVQTSIQQLESSYTVNPLDCDICFTCEEAEDAINEAIDEIATLDCENIYQLIVSELKENYDNLHPGNEDDYQPLESDIKAHAKYCQYEKCMKDKQSDVFDKQLARIADWSTAVTNNRTDLFASDPFFNDPALSGSAGNIHSNMEGRLNNMSIGVISYDNNNDNIPDGTHDFRGTLNAVTDPENTSFYIDDRGNANVNGYHILYYDLMSKRAALGETEYLSQLNEQRWVIYLNFYMESKRVTKKEAYSGCAAMVAQLGITESVPTTEEGIRDWAKQNGIGGDVSDIEVETGLQSIQLSCGTTLTPEENNTIRIKLKAYFNSRPDNHLRLILIPDLRDADNGGSGDLLEIENILQSHGCSLQNIAVEDPAACAESITITVPGGLPTEVPRILQGMPSVPNENTLLRNANVLNNDSISDNKTITKTDNSTTNTYNFSYQIDRSFLDELYSISEQNRLETNVSTNTTFRKSSTSSQVAPMSTATQTLIPQNEYDALVTIFNATGGAGWGSANSVGWVDGQIGGTPDVAGWVGVTVGSSGGQLHVTGLSLKGLTGVMPASISSLSYVNSLQISYFYNSVALDISNLSSMLGMGTLNLGGVGITGDLSSLSGMNQLTSLTISPSSVTGNIDVLSSKQELTALTLSGNIVGDIISLKLLVKLTELYLYSSNTTPGVTGDISVIGDYLKKLYQLKLYFLNLHGSIASFSNLVQLNFLDLQYISDLTGDFSSLSQLKSLRSIYLSHTKLGGNLSTFSLLEDLSYLTIDDGGPGESQVVGNISSLANLSQLNTFQILPSCPNITGDLNSFSGTALSTILLLNADLSGNLSSLPNSISRLTLEHCLSSGNVSELSNFPYLTSINLPNNGLTGNFPNLQSNYAISSINLSDNNITGHIPTTFNSNSLSQNQFNIGNNRFTFSDLIDFRMKTGFTVFPNQQKIDSEKNIFSAVGGSLTLSTTIDTSTSPSSVFKWYKNNQLIGNSASVTLNNLQLTDDGAVFYYTITNPIIPYLTLYSNNQTLVLTKGNQAINFEVLPTATIGGPSITLTATATSGLPVTFASSNTAVATVSGNTLTIVGAGSSIITASQPGNASYNAAPDVSQTLTTKRQDQTFVICQSLDTNNSTIETFTYVVDWAAEIAKCNARAAEQRLSLIELAEEKLLEEIISRYVNTFGTRCMANVKESLTYTYLDREYHHTLYYYDQAGSLVQTVPPEGVRALNASQVSNFIKGIKTEPAHALATNYSYNSLAQLTQQETPDAGESKFVYDDKGQLRVSQNAQQVVSNLFSYTRYDEQGRIAEVGETNLPYAINDKILADSTQTLHFPNTLYHTLTDVTRTHYDFADAGITGGFMQDYLRSRVSWVEVFETDAIKAVKTHYSYDIHGNVKSLQQKLPDMSAKRTDYVYDLISGKVNYVMYQYGKPDQFIHEYIYDADNRLRKAATSRDGYLWSTEANYDYYLHGPLARTSLGEYNVQGLDYYYTLQGWIKGVNMPFAGDPGKDGLNGDKNGKDVFAYTLGYYDGDYTPIGDLVTQSDTRDHLWDRSLENIQHTGLYNGNISWMVTDLPKLGEKQEDRTKGMQGMLYRYDQLHRITQSRSLTSYAEGSGFAARGTTASYDEDYTYDANGNILSLKRHDEMAVLKDDFTYDYYAGTNKLKNVKATQTQNYSYDAIGNLISDVEEGVTINWTPYGKVRNVQKGDSVTMSYRYDASGNRVEKKIIKGDSTYVTRYLRDASGNVMSIYKLGKPVGTDIEWKTKVALNYENGSIVPVTTGSTGIMVSNDWAEDNNPVEMAFTATGLGFKVAFLQDVTVTSPVFPFFTFFDVGTSRFVISSTNQLNLLEGQYKAGDHFRIRKEKDRVDYYVNEALVYTFSVTASVTAYRAYVVSDETMENFVFMKGNGSERQIEVPIYGSARLGQFKGEIMEGHRTLGHRNYELSNHLGNVLSVITDNAGMKPDDVWATVINTSDYYPFGLEMKGRSTNAVKEEETEGVCLECTELKTQLDAYVAANGEAALSDEMALTQYLNTQLNRTTTQTDYASAFEACRLVNTYASFTGGNYVDFGKQPQYELGTSDFTIEAWIRMPQGFGNEANAILTNQNYLSGGAYSGIHFLIGNHKLGFSVSEGAPEADAVVYMNSTFPDDNQWHHVVIERRGNRIADFRIYLDSVQSSLELQRDNLVTGDMNTGGLEALRIGTRKYTSSNEEYNFTGDIKQVRMYNRALSSVEVEQSYAQGLFGTTVNQNGLILWAPLDEGAGQQVRDLSAYAETGTHAGTGAAWKSELSTTTCATCQVLCTDQNTLSKEGLVASYALDGNAIDRSGNGHNGTLIGNPVVMVDSDGNSGGAIEMDGVDDYIEIANTPELNFTGGDFTVSMRVKKLSPTINWSNCIVVSKFNSGLAAGENEWIVTTSMGPNDNQAAFIVEGGTNQYRLSSGVEMELQKWYTITAMRKSEELRIYVNGELKATSNIGALVLNTTTQPIRIGSQADGYNSHAAFDDLMIYHRALSDAEVQSIHNRNVTDDFKSTASAYRYGFNGKEKDNMGSSVYDYGFRIYNPEIAKFLSVDPLSDKYPMLTPYQYASDNPILNIDIDGLEGEPSNGSSPTLFHNTSAGKEIFTKGFDASSSGKYSSYNWFSTTSNASGTGRVGVGVTLGVEGIDVSQAHRITEVQFKGWEAEAINEMGFADEASFKAEGKALGKKGFSALHKEMRGRAYSKMGRYMNVMQKAAYYVEGEGTYAVSDALANGGTIRSISGSTAVVKALNGLKWAGRTLIVVAAAKDLYEIHTSGYEPRTVVKKAGFWAGVWGGGAAFGAGYTATGLDLAGPWGWAGHGVTTIVGGVVGGFAGEAVSEIVYDNVVKEGAKPGMK